MAQTQQSKVLVYLIMILGLVLGFLYSTGSDPTAAVPSLDLELQLTSLKSLQGARIDNSILTSETFTSLRVFGSLPVKADAGGKSNPFE